MDATPQCGPRPHTPEAASARAGTCQRESSEQQRLVADADNPGGYASRVRHSTDWIDPEFQEKLRQRVCRRVASGHANGGGRADKEWLERRLERRQREAQELGRRVVAGHIGAAGLARLTARAPDQGGEAG